MGKKFKVLIPEPEWEESHSILEEIAEVKVGEVDKVYDENLLIDEIRDVDAIIITSQHHITRKVIEKGEKLKVVVKYGSKPGTDNVDYEAASEKGILICYTPGANSDSVAEHTIGLILALLKNLCTNHFRLRRAEWRDTNLLGYELLGKTVGIVGLGSVGCKVAEKLRGFGVELLAYTKAQENAKRVGATLVDLNTLLTKSDIVTVHTGLRDDTYHLIGEEELKLMKKSAIIINTARGAIINEKALIKALKKGWITGAGLDVFKEEPIRPDSPLLWLDNVILSPHSASFTYEAFRREAFTAAEEVLRVFQGKKPLFIANPKVIPKS
ncbi:MAG: hydroxyacid dehydrogenase [Candidatus Bathyarchaeota archaeon]|nr:hydroxyacid dehydrogenase [Candidatus Bathyarchaeota archaeon]MDH5745368.1 hydroxyacid dehydrogenase [Candidatus Bathyarchaeota archaeon]